MPSTSTVAVVVIGGDERSRQPALLVTDVAQPDRHDLAELALEVGRRPQRPLDARAGDLERVPAWDRIGLIQLA